LKGARSQTGFTLVEMVVVMLLIGVLAGVGAMRFASTESFAARGAADRLAAALRSAQTEAMARRTAVHVTMGASPVALTLCLDAGCTQPLAPPGNGSAWMEDVSGLSLSTSAAWQYQPDGSTDLASDLQVAVQGGSASQPPQISVTANTGHVQVR
jgi:MSHA pilin protein MshC